MNRKEWKTSGKFKGKYEWYNKTRKFKNLYSTIPILMQK